MADAVTTQILVDGPRNAVIKFTNISDGTGEVGVVKVTPSSLSGAPAEVAIDKVVYSNSGMGVEILWDATTPVTALLLAQFETDTLDFRDIGGIKNNAGAGKTGNIKFSTVLPTLNDTYTVVLYLHKVR